MFGSSFFGKSYFDGDYWSPITGQPQVITGGGAETYYSNSILADQIAREDEEVITIVMSFMGMLR